MKRQLRSLVLILLAGAVAVPALADVTVTAEINKTKDVFVLETIDTTKTVNLNAAVTLLTDTAAEAQAVVNTKNEKAGVFVGSRSGPSLLPPYVTTLSPSTLRRAAKLSNAVQSNTGVMGVNQDAGALANQGNVVSLGMVNTPGAFVNTQAEVQQVNKQSNSDYIVTPGEVSDPSNTLTNSILDNTGIVGVNQNTGNLNSQTNAVALAIGLGGARVALSEAALGQVNSGANGVQHRAGEVGTVNTNTIENVANNNVAIVGVNQASGSMNNQAGVVSFAAITSTVAVSTP